MRSSGFATASFQEELGQPFLAIIAAHSIAMPRCTQSTIDEDEQVLTVALRFSGRSRSTERSGLALLIRRDKERDMERKRDRCSIRTTRYDGQESFSPVFVLRAAAPQVRRTRRNQSCERRCP